MFGAGSAWPVDFAAVGGGRLAVVDHAAGDTPLEESDALFGRPLVVEGQRQPARVAAVVPEVHAWRGERLAQAAAEEAAPLLQRERAEADVAEIGQHVLDRVGLQHHAVLARGGRLRVAAAHRLVDRLARHGLDVEGADVDRRALRVTRAVVTHDDGLELGARAGVVGEPLQRVRHGHLADRRGEGAGGDEPLLHGQVADRLHAAGALLGRVGRGGLLKARHGLDGRGAGRPVKVRILGLEAGDGGGRLDGAGARRRLEGVTHRDAGPPPTTARTRTSALLS